LANKFLNCIKKYGHRKLVVLCLFLIFPIISIAMAGKHEWLVRIFVLIIVFGLGTPIFIWWAVNPKSQFISKSAKLNQPKYNKVKRNVTLLMRLFFLIIGFILFCGILVPFAIDVCSIVFAGEQPVVISAYAAHSSGIPLIELLNQEIIIEEDGVKSSYYFWYSLKPRLRRGVKYEFLILLRSKLILQARRIESENNSKELSEGGH